MRIKFGTKKIYVVYEAQKYAVRDFLERPHNIFGRYIFGTGGFLGTLMVTRSWKLATQSFQDFSNDLFKPATRRAGRLYTIARDKQIAGDKTYNFTEGLQLESLLKLDKFIEKQREKYPERLGLSGDQLYVWAAMMEADPERYLDFKSKFETLASQILEVKSEEKLIEFPRASTVKSGDFNVRAAREALRDFADLFDIDVWKWYIVSGTFLGLVREGGFLPHDYDLDFGINAEDFNFERFADLLMGSENFVIRKKDTLRIFQLEDSKLKHVDSKLVLLKIVHKTGVDIDVFVHYRENGVRWHGSSLHRWDNQEFTLHKCVFEGVEVYAPVEEDRYLTENYGDWRTPVTDFSCSTGTPNLTLVGNPSSVALFMKRISIVGNEQSFIKNKGILESAGFIDGNNLIL